MRTEANCILVGFYLPWTSKQGSGNQRRIHQSDICLLRRVVMYRLHEVLDSLRYFRFSPAELLYRELPKVLNQGI